MSNAIWVTPFLLLPGFALSAMSTSAHFARIHLEIQDLPEGFGVGVRETAKVLPRRSIFFRNILVVFFLAVAFLTIAGLVGDIVEFLSGNAVWLVIALIWAGIGCLQNAAIQRIKASPNLLDITGKQVTDTFEPRTGKGL